MDMVIPDEGKKLWLQWALQDDGTNFEDYVVELFKNNYTPDDDSEQSDFDFANFTGYVAVTLTRGSFSVPVVAAHVASSDAAVAPVFTCTGGAAQTVYGWLMYGADSFKVLAAQRFDVARSMGAGATETLTPFKIKLKTFA